MSSTKSTPPRQIGWFKRLFYHVLRYMARVVGVLFFELRCYGRENLPSGSALVLSTHQSHFDPVLVGLLFNDRLNYLARRTLFNNKLFAGLIRLLDAIELDRDRSGLAGLKETLKRLKAEEKVLIFPEGTRTTDGKISPLKPGFLAVARRSQALLVPVTVTGAYEVLPRGVKLPIRYPIRIQIGQPVKFCDYEHLSDDQTLQLLALRLQTGYRSIQRLRAEHF
ncbi:MAG: lysophospholipid acyltransferase family protein [Pirellulales bacterium]